jgi:glycerol-3-phosphate dehydrogenase
VSDASLSTHARASIREVLSREVFDLVVIGGGITGAGLARDAALRGVSVALLEANDFAAGTSSRSSKLIHGGLRYLERGEVNLVRKTALERKEIFRAAPHLAEPRWMVIPLAGRAMLYSLRLAVTTYERLGAVARRETHRTWTGSLLAEQEPALDRQQFPHALAYREYLTDDARLVIANVRAAAAAGAVVLNHAPVIAVLESGQRAIGVEARCSLSAEQFAVRGRVIVNAAGPWVEAVQRLENPEARPFLHLSKGIHITVPAAKLPVRNLLMLNTADKRRIFALRRGEVVYVGTTDTTYEPGADLWPTIEAEDVDYLLETLGRYFTCAPIGRGDVIGAWAGLRPLIADPTKKNPSELSRRDELLLGPLGVLSIAGGKLTGYRGMARRVLETVGERLGRPVPELGEDPPLPGGDFDGDLEALAGRLAAAHPLDEATAIRLARLYGAEAPQVLDLGAQPIVPGARCVAGEVRWAVEREGAATLEDLVYRRTRLPLYELDTPATVEALAQVMGEVLGWSDAQRADEIAQVRARLDDDLRFKLG